MGIKPDAASRSTVYRCTQRYGAVATDWSGCAATDSWGARVFLRKHFSGLRPFRRPFQPQEGS